MLVAIDELRLNVFDEGHGETLLFIHGMGATHTNWDGQLDMFRKRFRCLALDLPGLGRSTALPGSVTLEALADTVAKLCETRRLGVGCVIGQSLGGMVAQTLAIRHPEMVPSLVLVGTACVGRRDTAVAPGLRGLSDQIRRNGTTSIVDALIDAIFPTEFRRREPLKVRRFADQLLAAEPRALISYLNRTAATDFLGGLPACQMPALVVVGEDDRVCPPIESEFLAELLPHATLVKLPHRGHQPHYEDPAQFNELLADFLAERGHIPARSDLCAPQPDRTPRTKDSEA